MAREFFKRHTLPVFVAALLGAIFALIPEVHASGFLPLPDNSNLDLAAPEGDTGIEKAENLLGPLGRVIRIIVGAVAVLMIVISGVSMVIAGDNEETAKNQKKAIKFAMIGLALISIAGPMAEVFDFRRGNILEDADSFTERAQLFDDATRIVVTFLKYLLGSLAALMFISSGATMIMGSHNEENITRSKKNLALGAGGLFLVVISDLLIRRILYDAEYNESAEQTIIAINQNELVSQVVAFTNILVSFVGPILMLGLVIGGVLYVTAGGDEERTGMAKKIIMNSVIGIIIIYGAFAIVTTIISGSF